MASIVPFNGFSSGMQMRRWGKGFDRFQLREPREREGLRGPELQILGVKASSSASASRNRVVPVSQETTGSPSSPIVNGSSSLMLISNSTFKTVSFAYRIKTENVVDRG